MGIMALLIAVELLTLWFAVGTLSSVRACVGGEGLWSKAQKDAIYHLEKYGHTRDQNDYNDYLLFMRVPEGDHKARLELSKANPDMNIVRQGFIEGRNNPKDVDGMSHLFRRFNSISYIEKAISNWGQADSMSRYLIPVADSLHKEIISANPSQEKIDALLQQIGPINYELTKLEDDFSYTLGEGSRWLENLILKILFSIALTVEISGLLLTVSVSRSIQKGLREIILLSKEIAIGNFKVRAKKYSQDEIGELADSFNGMADELEHNISARKQSSELLKESEERFKLIVENIRDFAIVMVDLDGKVVSWNEGAERITGYSEEEIYGKHIDVFYPEDEVQRGSAERNLKTAREKGNYKNEGWRKRKDGTLFWADVLTTPLYDETGSMRGYAKIIRDITERKMAENELRENQSQLAMAQELAHIGSWEWIPEKNSLRWSEEMFNIYGLEKKNGVQVDKIAAMTHPDDQDDMQKIIREAMVTKKPFEFYYRIIRTDNSIRNLHTRGNIVLNEAGEVEKLLGTDQDVTDRFREEEMEKLVIAATKSTNSVIIVNSEGKVEWVNEGFTKLTGYTFEDVRNTHAELLKNDENGGLTNRTPLFEKVLREKKSFAYEGKNFTKDGKEYWVITTLTPVLGKDGEVERIIAIDSDITQRKQIEEDLIMANRIAEDSLKKGNKALTDLMRAKKQLEESMQVKEQFLAKMSHEIRTPMNAIVGLTELLLESKINADQKECIDAIKLSSDNLLSIINDILDFSKLESGKVTLEKLPFNPDEVVEGTLITLGVSASRKNIALKYVVDKNSIPESIIGDAVRLRQILLNLLSNSIKFTEHGSVTINMRVLEQDDSKCTMQFVVSDTGIGIPEDRIETIFESFTQASNETSRKYGGTGLGLTIVKQLTEMQGGSISVKSKVNEGTEIAITLPFEKNKMKGTSHGTNGKKVPDNNLGEVRVLLAEDNEMNQMLANKIFNKWRFHLDIADNGKEAIEKLRTSDYDLVLMDIQMPEMDGYEATQFIRHKLVPPKSEIPIIAMTAHAIVGEADKCISLGMDDYISKPFNQQTLYDKISSLLHKKHSIGPAEHVSEIPMANMENYKHIDLSYLHEIAEGNKEFMKKMINAFLSQSPAMAADMQKAVEEKRWKDLRGIAHKMRPSLDFIGIHAIKDIVRDIEKFSLEEINSDLLPGMVAEVNEVCKVAIEELKMELTKIS
jgi:PAS domain S-box-containing protein